MVDPDPALGEEGTSGLRHLDRSGRTSEQLHADLRLEFRDEPAETRLGRRKALRGPAEMKLLREDEAARDMPDIEPH